jgi:hypothetical protein
LIKCLIFSLFQVLETLELYAHGSRKNSILRDLPMHVDVRVFRFHLGICVLTDLTQLLPPHTEFLHSLVCLVRVRACPVRPLRLSVFKICTNSTFLQGFFQGLELGKWNISHLVDEIPDFRPITPFAISQSVLVFQVHSTRRIPCYRHGNSG